MLNHSVENRELSMQWQRKFHRYLLIWHTKAILRFYFISRSSVTLWSPPFLPHCDLVIYFQWQANSASCPINPKEVFPPAWPLGNPHVNTEESASCPITLHKGDWSWSCPGPKRDVGVPDVSKSAGGFTVRNMGGEYFPNRLSLNFSWVLYLSITWPLSCDGVYFKQNFILFM